MFYFEYNIIQFLNNQSRWISILQLQLIYGTGSYDEGTIVTYSVNVLFQITQ